jgi:hypothetical protein
MPTLIRHPVRPGLLVATAAALIALAALDHAWAGSGRRAACTSDVFRLCNTEVPRVNHIVSCLKKERPNLSPGCRAVVGDGK